MKHSIKGVLFLMMVAFFFSNEVQAKEDFLGNLDSLSEGAVVESNQLTVRGWLLHKEGVGKINIYLDDELIGEADYGFSREDVASTYPSIPESDKSGYETLVDISDISEGKHVLTIEGVTKLGTVGVVSKTNFVRSIALQGVIETPSKAYTLVKGNSIEIVGQVLSKRDIKTVQVWLDGQFVSEAKTKTKTVPLKDNPSGFKLETAFQYTLDISKAYKGKHQIDIKVELPEGTMLEVGKRVFEKQFNYPMLILLIVSITAVYASFKIKRRRKRN